MGQTHNKLVRDKIPEIITSHGETPVTRVLNEAEYRHELLKKLVEEATELLESNGSLEERADVAEVLRALDETLQVDSRELEAMRAKKAVDRGAFRDRIYLEKTV